MAAVTGTVSSVFDFQSPIGPERTTAGAEIVHCKILVTYTGTYAAADDSSTANVHTAIANSRQDGKTYALVSACWAGFGDEAGAKIGAKTVATSTNTMTATLTTADASTEHADGAMGAWHRGVCFAVTLTAT